MLVSWPDQDLFLNSPNLDKKNTICDNNTTSVNMHLKGKLHTVPLTKGKVLVHVEDDGVWVRIPHPKTWLTNLI